MKKISIIYDFLDEVGGLERVMFDQANLLSKNFSPTLRFFYIKKRMLSTIIETLRLKTSIHIHQLGSSKTKIKALLQGALNNALFSDDSDLILTHSFLTTTAAYRKQKHDGTPYIVYLHHPPNFLYNTSFHWANTPPRIIAYILGTVLRPLLRHIDRKAVRAGKKWLVNSNYTARRIEKIYGVKPQIIFPAVSDDFYILFPETARAELKRPLPDKFMLMHGRMISDKRPDWGLQALALLGKQCPDLHLVLSGTVENQTSLIKLAEKLNIINKVHFIGYQTPSQLVALYNCASVFLMPAPKEDFGLTPVEAIACGCPVVAWNDGAGPSETVNPGIIGFLATPYDIKSFASCIIKATELQIDNQQFTEEVSRFSKEQAAHRLETTIQQLLEEQLK